MRIILGLLVVSIISCGYGDLKDKIEGKETTDEASETVEATETTAEASETEVNAEITSEKKASEEVVLLTEGDFVESCTPGSFEGDFAVSVLVEGNTDFKAFFDQESECNNAYISYQDGVVEGGVCSNQDDFVLFHEADLKPTRLVITRSDGQITWQIYDSKGYKQLQYLTIKEDFETPVVFCKTSKV